MSAVQMHPSAFYDYIRNGWKLCAVPAGTKGPQVKGWNKLQNALTEPPQAPDGAGLLHAYSGTCSIDIDQLDAAITLFAERGMDLNELLDGPTTVQVDSGNPGHGKMLFKLSVPLPSKRINHNGRVALEFRCASAGGESLQDVLPPSRHPSGTTYRWAGLGRWQNLPELPEALHDWWMEIIEKDNDRTIPLTGSSPANWNEVRSAVFAINPSCAHDDWLTVGMALHSIGTHTGDLDTALQLWNEWSRTSEDKYPGPAAILTRWRSFTGDHPIGIKAGSLFKLAKDHGWIRPQPDVTHLFKAIDLPVSTALLSRGLVEAPPVLDLDLLPPVLAQRVREVATSVGCDPLVPAWAGLAAIAAAANAESRLELVDGYKVPPVLWLMTIGSPAAKKTPGAKPMLKILGDIEREDHERFAADLLLWQAEEAHHSHEYKTYLESAKSAEAGEHFATSLTPVGELRKQPVSKRLTVGDITSQKLVRVCEQRPEGVMAHFDELAGWIKKIANPASGEDRSCWVVAYEANYYSMDRVGAGELSVSNLAVSIYGNVQPKVFRNAVPKLADDGLLQRFLPAILHGADASIGEPIPEWLTTASDYERMIRRVHAQPRTDYRLSESARVAFREFQQWVMTIKQRDRLLQASDVFQTAFGKIEGTCGRLAHLLHLAESPDSVQLSGELMTRVVRIVQSYIVPALRYAFGEVAGISEGSFDHWVRDYIVSVSDQSHVTLSEIARSAKRQLEGLSRIEADEQVRLAMAGLEALGWVILESDTYKAAKWAIHPGIATAFAEHRAKVINARADQIEEVRKLIIATGQKRAEWSPVKRMATG